MLNTGTALEFNLLKVLYPFRREDVNIFLQKPIDRCPNAKLPPIQISAFRNLLYFQLSLDKEPTNSRVFKL